MWRLSIIAEMEILLPPVELLKPLLRRCISLIGEVVGDAGECIDTPDKPSLVRWDED
jgi:hypothetical protein